MPPSQLLAVAGNPWLVDASLQSLPLSSLRLLPSKSMYLNLSLCPLIITLDFGLLLWAVGPMTI